MNDVLSLLTSTGEEGASAVPRNLALRARLRGPRYGASSRNAIPPRAPFGEVHSGGALPPRGESDRANGGRLLQPRWPAGLR